MSSNFNTAKNAIIITNLTTMTTYTFSVVATNSIGSGEAGVVMITTPGEDKILSMLCKYNCVYAYCLLSLLYLPNLLSHYWGEP